MDVELLLISELVSKKINKAFDISECSYDYYPREDVKRAELELKEYTKIQNILTKLKGDD